MDATLAALSEFTATTRYDDLPEAAVDTATEILVDTLGCLVGGRDCRAVAAGLGLAAAGGSAAEWGVAVGRPGRYPTELAAFVNSAMIRYLDFNDHLVAGHASDMIGALLAVTGRPDAPVSGADLLTAITVAYEVHARLVEPMRKNNTIDRTYSITIGATAGLASLLGLSPDATTQALSIATTIGPMLRASRAGALSDFKGAASAVSAKLAVFCAQIAGHGLTGPSEPFEGRHGVRELFEGEQGPFPVEPFGDWQILQTCHKFWPVAYGIQPAIWTALGLREQVSPAEVEKVVLHAAPFAWFESGTERERWDPRSRESADHSMPYAFARALEYGTVDQAAFRDEAWRDPGTLALMQRIVVEPDWARGPKISDVVGCRAELTTTAGQTHVVNVDEPRGHYRNPMTPEEITGKTRRLVEPALGDRTDAAIEAAWNVRTAPTLDAVLTAFLF
jgi:2-methylcitrate dehydratase